MALSLSATNETWTNQLEHPAVQAWSKLHPERVSPGTIETLKRNKKSAIYRLETLDALVAYGLRRIISGKEAEGWMAQPVLLRTNGLPAVAEEEEPREERWGALRLAAGG